MADEERENTQRTRPKKGKPIEMPGAPSREAGGVKTGYLFGGAMVAVLVGGIVLSELMVDPNCTEGPCRQDGVLYAAIVVDLLIGLAWLITGIGEEVDHDRDRDRDRDRDQDR